jgi:diguanylate cyclase (GGDEF)-like protein/PAS domain S-box-containing protein
MAEQGPVAGNEQRRLETLKEYLAFDILANPVFTRLTGVVARLFAVPIAAISVVDASKQIVKAAFGWDVRELPRRHSFCAHAILSDRVMLVPDARRDPRFRQNPLVASGIRFYAGVPLRTKEDLCLGTLSIMDHAPRRLDDKQVAALRDLAGMAMSELDLRYSMARTIAAVEEGISGELRYRELFDNANDIVYTHDLQGRFTSVNKAAQKHTGYTREEALGMSIYDMASPEARQVIREAIQDQIGGTSQATHEVEIIAKDGRKLTLEVNTRMLFRRGIPVAVQGIARDITERKKAEAQLRLLRSVVVNANDAVMVAEATAGNPFDSKIVYVNEAFSRISGHDGQGALALTPRVLLGPQTDPRQVERIGDAVRNCVPTRAELTCYRKDGSEFWVDLNIVPILDEDAAFTYWVAVLRETTDRKRAEILERDRNEVLELVAGNAPLETVLGRLGRLVERQCPGSVCSVLLARNSRLYFAATPALPQAVVDSLEGSEIGSEEGPAAAAGSGKPAILEDLTTIPSLQDSRKVLLSAGLRACWAVPILSGEGNALGAFAVFNREPRRPLASECEVLEMVSRLAAVGIEQRQLNNQLAYQARHDALTGLPNRLQLAERLRQELDKARRNGWIAAVLFIDLDRFKQINDTLGHSVGDALLRQVSQRFESCIRSQDILARMGGDEFTLVLSELKDPQDALRVAQKLLDSLKAPFHVDAYELFVTASVGISVYPRDGRDAVTLQRNADSAMYRAKYHGKNNCRFFTPELGAAARERLEIETALRRAIRHGELELCYQPLAELSGKLAGLEALLVWRDPKLGVVPPSQFIPIAEESGLIVPLGGWVLAEACRQNAAWQRRGLAPVTVAANVSPMQFARADFVETVSQALAHSGLDPSLLELELTESVVMRDVEESARQMERLRALGVGIAIDDFGTGYSSLSYLRRLPIDTLKIDQSFLKELETDDTTLILVHAIVAVAHSLKLTVVAEGVENERQLAALRSAGCDRIQGYLLGEPLPQQDVEELLAKPEKLLLRTSPLVVD